MNKRFSGLDSWEAFVVSEDPGIPLSKQIASYLERQTCHDNLLEGDYVILPSLMALARFFHTGHLEVYDAFQHLRKQGFDYHLLGLENPIRFWHTVTIPAEPQN